MTELATEFEIHPSQISTWKLQACEALPEVFTDGRKDRKAKTEQALTEQQYQQIGQLQVELTW